MAKPKKKTGKKSVVKEKAPEQEPKKEVEMLVERKVKAVEQLTEEMIKSIGIQLKAVWVLLRKPFVTVPEITVIMLVDDTDSFDSRRLWGELSKVESNLFSKYNITFRVTMYRLTEYWELIRQSSPIIFNEIREAVPIYDPAGYFVPFKKLVEEGRVPGTREAMFNLIGTARNRLRQVKMMFINQIVEQLFQSAIDAGQAPLLLIGVLSPPRHVAESLRVHFVEPGFLEPEYARYVDDIYKLWKGIEHGEVKDLTGKNIDRHIRNIMAFVDRIEELIPELEKRGMVRLA